LTLCRIVIGEPVNRTDASLMLRNGLKHSMWYHQYSMLPHLAVNKIERAWSRRFGRDSFQSRSTS